MAYSPFNEKSNAQKAKLVDINGLGDSFDPGNKFLNQFNNEFEATKTEVKNAYDKFVKDLSVKAAVIDRTLGTESKPAENNYASVRKTFDDALATQTAKLNTIYDAAVEQGRVNTDYEAKKADTINCINALPNLKVEHYKKTRDYTIFRLLSFSGCRIGEILALNWQDVNFITGELDIHKTLTKARFHYISQTPKTRNSQRIIYLDDATIHYLTDWQKIQLDYLNKHGYQRANYIFTNSKNNFTINQAITERYKLYQEEANLKYIGLHGFRHTHASLLFEAGIDYKDIQERLGHVNIKTTMDIYTHLCDSRKQETVKKLSQFVEF